MAEIFRNITHWYCQIDGFQKLKVSNQIGRNVKSFICWLAKEKQKKRRNGDNHKAEAVQPSLTLLADLKERLFFLRLLRNHSSGRWNKNYQVWPCNLVATLVVANCSSFTISCPFTRVCQSVFATQASAKHRIPECFMAPLPATQEAATYCSNAGCNFSRGGNH